MSRKHHKTLALKGIQQRIKGRMRYYQVEDLSVAGTETHHPRTEKKNSITLAKWSPATFTI